MRWKSKDALVPSQTLESNTYHQEFLLLSLQPYSFFRPLKANSSLATSSGPYPTTVKLGSFLSPLLPPLIASHLKSCPHPTSVPLPVTWLVLPSHFFLLLLFSLLPHFLFGPPVAPKPWILHGLILLSVLIAVHCWFRKSAFPHSCLCPSHTIFPSYTTSSPTYSSPSYSRFFRQIYLFPPSSAFHNHFSCHAASQPVWRSSLNKSHFALTSVQPPTAMPGRWGGFGHHLCTAQVMGAPEYSQSRLPMDDLGMAFCLVSANKPPQTYVVYDFFKVIKCGPVWIAFVKTHKS